MQQPSNDIEDVALGQECQAPESEEIILQVGPLRQFRTIGASLAQTPDTSSEHDDLAGQTAEIMRPDSIVSQSVSFEQPQQNQESISGAKANLLEDIEK